MNREGALRFTGRIEKENEGLQDEKRMKTTDYRMNREGELRFTGRKRRITKVYRMNREGELRVTE